MSTHAPVLLNTLLRSKSDALTDLNVGEVIMFPRREYWRVNSARQRAAKGGARFALRSKGSRLFVVRVA